MWPVRELKGRCAQQDRRGAFSKRFSAECVEELRCQDLASAQIRRNTEDWTVSLTESRLPSDGASAEFDPARLQFKPSQR